MKALVVGFGSIARRHIHNLKILDPKMEIGVWRHTPKKSDFGDTEPLINHVFTSLGEVSSFCPDFALLTNPASLHIETGLALAEQNIHLFVEKPISDTLCGVQTLIELCRERKLILMVGYNFRFYYPLQALRELILKGQIGKVLTFHSETGQFLPDWRPHRDYKKVVSARHELGGGVVLELSHELDYARWIIGEMKTVSAHVDRVSELEIDVEDTADIIAQFTNGAIGSIHLDMLQRVPVRTCRIVGTLGTLTWDGINHTVRCYTVETREWKDVQFPQRIDPNEMYIKELAHFLDCISAHGFPIIDGEDGKRVLEIALAVKLSSKEQRAVSL